MDIFSTFLSSTFTITLFFIFDNWITFSLFFGNFSAPDASGVAVALYWTKPITLYGMIKLCQNRTFTTLVYSMKKNINDEWVLYDRISINKCNTKIGSFSFSRFSQLILLNFIFENLISSRELNKNCFNYTQKLEKEDYVN